MNVNLFGAIFFIFFGLCLFIFHKIFGKLTVEFQYRIFHIRFSEIGYQVAFFIVGVLSVIWGVLSLSGVIKYR